MKRKTPKELTTKEALVKMASYCAYQERCHSEVHQKLMDLGVRGLEVQEIIDWLEDEKFLNELRFAKAFAGGKFRLKSWGKIKISQALMQKKVKDEYIHIGLEEIDSEDYFQTLHKLLSAKNRQLNEELEPFKRKQKLFNYAVSKGYEPDVIWAVIKELDLVH
jgi:regulatory protein